MCFGARPSGQPAPSMRGRAMENVMDEAHNGLAPHVPMRAPAAGINRSGGGYAPPDSAQRPQTALDNAVAIAEQRMDDAAAICQRLAAMLTRVRGQSPDGPRGTNEAVNGPAPSGAMGQLHAKMQITGMLHARAHELLTELEPFV